MKLLTLTIHARSPLVFPERKPGAQFRRSLGYIPGATIYGALGAHLAKLNRFNKALFEDMRCHNAYPAWSEDAWSRPLPRTAEKPKGQDEATPRDTLVERVCWEQIRPLAMIFSPTDDNGRAWEGDGGFYAPALPADLDLRQQIKRNVYQRVLTRVSINRRRGTAEDRLLYSPLALSEVNTRRTYRWNRQDNPAVEEAVKHDFWSQFLGSVVVPDGYDLNAADLMAITRLGGRITTGLGQVEIQATETSTETAEDIRTRIERLTVLFRQRAAVYQSLGGRDWPVDGVLFTVDLLADAILLEHGWQPTMVLTADMLREATGIQADLRLLRSFATYGYVGGWNLQWSAPKPTEVSTLMGSVFVFYAPDGLAPEDYQRLADMQLQGIGERRSEGFGQIRICDEFHTDAALF